MNNNDDNDQKKPPVLNFGDDDEFVVPDHIQKVIDEVHGQSSVLGSQSSDSGQSVDHSAGLKTDQPTTDQRGTDSPVPEQADRVVSFENSESDIPVSQPTQEDLPSHGPPPPTASVDQESLTTTSPPGQNVENSNFDPTFSADVQVADHEQEPNAEAVQPDEMKTDESTTGPQKTENREPKTDSSSSSIFDTAPVAAEEPQFKLPKKKILRPTKKIMAVIAMGAVGISLLFFGFGIYSRAGRQAAVIGASKISTNDMIAKVAQLIDLGLPESPSQLANVTDTRKLANNPFFDHAKNGDVVLIYSKNQIAVLYRPSTNKIVAVGPITPSGSQSVAGASTQTVPAPTTAVAPTATPTIPPPVPTSSIPSVSPSPTGVTPSPGQ